VKRYTHRILEDQTADDLDKLSVDGWEVVGAVKFHRRYYPAGGMDFVVSVVVRREILNPERL
jgi:hypothetical protein